MTFAAPWFLAGGALAALGLIALHFLARREPEQWQLPTARFVPESSERAPARSLALSDRLLLALRLLAVVAAALAFARPSWNVRRTPLVQVIVADRSRAVADTALVGRAVASVRHAGDRVLDMHEGSLSAALLRAIREARALRDATDSVAIVLVSPLAREEFDAATLAIRATWPGGIRLQRVAAAPGTGGPRAVALRAAPGDPLRATLALSGVALADSAPVRLVREAGLTAADSSWAGARGHLLLHWPAASGPARDTVGAVVTNATVLIAGFARSASPLPGTPVAWWVDGGVAAAEVPLGDGCLRRVAVPVPAEGDLVLGDRFRALTRDLLAPCGGARDLRPADDSVMKLLAGGAASAVPASVLPIRPDAGRAAVPWLLLLALASLGAEQLVRRRSAA